MAATILQTADAVIRLQLAGEPEPRELIVADGVRAQLNGEKIILECDSAQKYYEWDDHVGNFDKDSTSLDPSKESRWKPID